MDRRLSRMLLLVLLAGITFLFPLLAPTPHRIDDAHFDLIQEGMAQAEVEAIFGVPPGNYDWAEPDYRGKYVVSFSRTRGGVGRAWLVKGAFAYHEFAPSAAWTSRHGVFTVYYSDEGRVRSKTAWRSVRITAPWERWLAQLWQK